MKTIQALKLRLRRMLTDPGEELGRGARFLRFQVHLWRFCARRLRENNALAMSSALSFRTIFALVPVLVLALTVLSTFGGLEHGKQSLRGVLAAAGLDRIAVAPVEEPAASQPASAPAAEGAGPVNLADKVLQLVSHVEGKLTLGRVGPIGAVLLVWSAVTLLTTVERSLNRIFDAPRSRSLGRRILLYWSAVTLGPLLLVAAVYLFRRAETALGRAPAVGWLLAAANWAGPVLVGIALLAALYKLLPNTKVRYRAAVGGAVIAVPLWLAAKWAFGLYLTEVVGAGSLYGALGLLPLFLIWLNTSWLIFLFGGELAHTAANLRRLRSAERAQRTVAGPWDLLAAALAVAGPYVAGRGPADVTSVAGRLGLPAETARRLLEALTRLGVVCPVESPEEAYVPARPVADVKVADVLAAAARDGAAGGDYDPALARAVKAARERAAGALGELTLADALQANLPTSQGSICTETSGEPS